MITAHRVTKPDWPKRESSAYVDWWIGVEYPDLSPAMTLVDFETVVDPGGGCPRFCPCATPTSTGPRRRAPLRRQAVPDPMPGPINPNEFGDPLDRTPVRPAAVMVVIDSDINPLHEQMFDAAGRPRLLAHWLMEGPWAGGTRVPYGRELRQAELVAALAAPTEDRGLRRLGLADFATPFAARGTMLPSAHGTHIMALAAGTKAQDNSPDATALRDVPVLAVSLPSNKMMSAAGVFLEVFVDQALAWVSARLTEAFGKDWPPVVVNLSYGLAAGPKDASGHLNDRLRDWLLAHPQVRFFMPAGNYGLDDKHAVLSPQDKGGIGWMLPPSDPFTSYAELWFDRRDGDTALILTPPGQGCLCLPLTPGAVFDLRSGAATVGRVYMMPGETPFRQGGCLIALAPTRPRQIGAARVPCGIWTLAVSGPADLRATLHLQSEHPLKPNSLTNPPSRLISLSEDGPDPRQQGSVNAIGPGTGVTIVNGSNAQTGALSEWTSRGDPEARPALEDGVAFPADRSLVLQGLLAPSYRSGSVAVVEGTSFSTGLASREALLGLISPRPDQPCC